jgi:DNA-binding MarR family transcriptional regulator
VPRKSAIQEELKQKRPFASPTAEAVVALARTNDLARRRLSDLLEARGLTLQQYNVLRILRGAGEAGLPTLEIADRMIERAPGVTRLLDRLERKGLVRRERCAEDRRQVLCTITGAGLDVLSPLDAPVLEAGRRFMSPLGPRELALFLRFLDRLRAGS